MIIVNANELSWNEIDASAVLINERFSSANDGIFDDAILVRNLFCLGRTIGRIVTNNTFGLRRKVGLLSDQFKSRKMFIPNITNLTEFVFYLSGTSASVRRIFFFNWPIGRNNL